jgi:hypothetical protein
MFNTKGQRFKGSKGLVWLLLLLLCPFVPLSLCVEATQSTAQFALAWKSISANSNQFIVEVGGLNAATLKRLQQARWQSSQWQRLLAVYAGQTSAQTSVPPMLGAYRVENNALRFEPQFPLEPGLTYQAVFHPEHLPGQRSAASKPVTATFQLPPRNTTPSTVVTQIYPSADVLPENLLKFYLYFSAPMSRGRIYEHIHLRDAAGKEIELPFLEIDEELWDATLTRLTLFIDPGRIKRGVLPLEEIGPALEAGKSYTLMIDRAWRDGAGNPLKQDFQKTFSVAQPDRDPIDPARWQLQAPKSGTREPLVVSFAEPLDHALAQRLINVSDATGAIVTGQVALEQQERRWVFVPSTPWPLGRYQLVVQTTIEDLAGNNIGKPFEVDLFEGVQRRITTSSIKLPFEVR